MLNKCRLPFIILGIGIGILLTNTIYIFNPKMEYRDYSEEEIIAKATELGMVFIKNNIETSTIKDDNENFQVDVEKSGDKENETGEKKEIQFIIEYGDSLEKVSKGLYELEIIDDMERFLKFAKDKKVDRKLRVGNYKLSLDSDYETIIKVFTSPQQ